MRPDASVAKTPVSVIVPVKNEADNLRRCLPALSWADEVFVVDSQSSDETVDVAEALGAKVVSFHFNGTYPKKKNWALENLPFRNEWVLIVDADEVVLPALAGEITTRIASDEADGYYLNSRYYFLGRQIRHCGYSDCWNLRLFKHRLGRYEKMLDHTGGRTGDNETHEHVELDGRVLRLENQFEHHAYPTIAAWVEKHNRYAIWEAALSERFLNEPIPSTLDGGKRFRRLLKKIAWRLPMRPLFRFVYAYFLRLGFLDGKPGFIFCGLLAFYDFLASANRYEQQLARGLSNPDPEAGAFKALELPASERKARDLLDRQALTSLECAISIEGQTQTKLEQLTNNGKRYDPLRREIQDLIQSTVGSHRTSRI